MSSPTPLVGAAVCAMSLLWLATFFTLDTTEKKLKDSNAYQMEQQLNLVDQLVENWQQEHLNNIRNLSQLSWVEQWVAQQLTQPLGVAERSLAYQQMRQLYLQQGYHGHVLYDSDGHLRDDANQGVPQAFEQPEEALAVLAKAKREGAAISQPFAAPLHLYHANQPVGTPVYMVCTRVTTVWAEGYLCLHFDQENGLEGLLSQITPPKDTQLYLSDQQNWHLGAKTALKNIQIPAGYHEHTHARLATYSRFSQPLKMNIVLETSLDTLYTPYYLGRSVLYGLCLLASMFLAGLLVIFMRSRHLLATRESLYRQLLNQLPMQVRVRDLNGMMIIENDHARRGMFDIAKDLFLNKNTTELTGLSLSTWELQQEIKHKLAFKERQIVSGSHTDIDFYAVKLIGFPIFDPQHKLIALGSIALDETNLERRRQALQVLTHDLEQQVQERTAELAEARDAAEGAARAKADFLANMSHEIRSPLSAVLGLAHLAERSNQAPQVASYLQRIITAAGHLQEMLNDILDFSKFEAGKLKLERIAFSPERLLESVADIIWDKAQRKNLSVLFDLDPHLPEQFYGDPLRLSQILINLADNAIKFTAEGMVAIRIRALSNQGNTWQVCFEVQDSGIGIPPEDIEHIFKPFEQLDQSIARRHGGTGLGLPICRQLAKLMDATFEARSQPGLGSLFSITVTLTQVSAQAEPLVLTASSHRALLVDAKEPSRASLSGKLAALGLHVEHAQSAQHALTLLSEAQQPFHWIFIDWDLPDMASHDFAAQLREQNIAPNSLCVLLCGRGTGRMLPPEVLKHFVAVLDKPVSPLKLRETVLCLEQPSLPTFNGQHVLLVEDEPLNQEVACELLKALNIKVTVAPNGALALELLRKHTDIELVLMDIQMPVLDGLATLEQLRPRHPHLPVIAMTGNCLPGDRERYLAAGMNDYLAKPFQPEALAFLLNRWLSAVPENARALNQAQALERLLGNQALYERLLVRFRQDYADFAERLKACLAAEDHRQAGKLLHSFKSLVATIGAEGLQSQALHMESQLRQGLCIKEQANVLAKALHALLDEIDTLLAVKEVDA